MIFFFPLDGSSFPRSFTRISKSLESKIAIVGVDCEIFRDLLKFVEILFRHFDRKSEEFADDKKLNKY